MSSYQRIFSRSRRKVLVMVQGLVGEARVEDFLIFRRERRVLRMTQRLGRVPLVAEPRRFTPLPREIGILRIVEGKRVSSESERGAECDGTNERAIHHRESPIT